jgi:hypothetical protein
MKPLLSSIIALICLGIAPSVQALQVFDSRAEFDLALGNSTKVVDTFSKDIPQDEILDLESGILSINSQNPMFTDNSVFDGYYHNAVSDFDRSTSDTIIWQFPYLIQAFGVDLLDGDDPNDVDSLAFFTTINDTSWGFLFDPPNSFFGLILDQGEKIDDFSLFAYSEGWDVFRFDNATFVQTVEVEEKQEISEPSIVLGLILFAFCLPFLKRLE